MGDYFGIRVLAKVDKAFGKVALCRYQELHATDTFRIKEYLDALATVAQAFPAMHLLEYMYSGSSYFEFEVDNYDKRLSEESIAGPDDVDPITIHDDHAIIDTYLSTRTHRFPLIELSLRAIADHLLLEDGQSICFAMTQWESGVDRFEGTQAETDFWFASKGSKEGANVLLHPGRVNIIENGFPACLVQPFSTHLLNRLFVPQAGGSQQALPFQIKDLLSQVQEN